MQNRRSQVGARRASRQPTKRGAAAVEFAIIAPLLFLMVFGCIELSRALMVQQVLTNASRVGARRASLINATQLDVVKATAEYALGGSVAGVAVSVKPDPQTAQTGELLTVTASVAFDEISWVPAPWFLGGATLRATSVMRKEGFE